MELMRSTIQTRFGKIQSTESGQVCKTRDQIEANILKVGFINDRSDNQYLS